MRETTDIRTDNSARDSARGRRKSESAREPVALPQWTVEKFIRPTLWSLCRLFWKLRHTGVENIPPPQGGLIVAANHQTYIDPFWVSAPIRRPIRYLAWSEAFDWPLVGRMMELLGAWPLQIEGIDATAIRRSLQWLRKGGVVMIFPEGGRCLSDGSMSNFKQGAVRLAMEANVPILPVTIRGGHSVWPKGQRLPRFSEIEVIYHPARHIKIGPGEDARQCARRETRSLAAIIESAL